MGRDGEHWLQTDERWAQMLWYLPAVQDSLIDLTCEIQCLAFGHSRAPAAVLRELEKFNRQVKRFVERPAHGHGSSSTLIESGCLLVSHANLLKFLGVTIQGEEPTPPVLLEALQDEYMLTLTGYCAEAGVDPISILTDGAVSICKTEEFGRAGARPMKSEILRKGLRRGYAAIVNTVSHAYLSSRMITHFVVVTERVGNNFRMLDPGFCWPKGEWLLPRYKKVFAVSLYRRRGKRRR